MPPRDDTSTRWAGTWAKTETSTGNWTSTAKIEGPDNDHVLRRNHAGDIDGNGSLDLLFMSFYGNSTEYKLYYKTDWKYPYNGPTVLTKYYTLFESPVWRLPNAILLAAIFYVPIRSKPSARMRSAL
jgi:hypothetical protein